MHSVTVNRSVPESAAIREAVRVLHDGGVIVHPTETCYGLAVRVDQKTGDSLDRLYVLKKMERTKPMSILVASFLEKQEKQPFVRKAIISLDTLKFLLYILWEIKALDAKKRYAAM